MPTYTVNKSAKGVNDKLVQLVYFILIKIRNSKLFCWNITNTNKERGVYHEKNHESADKFC